VLHLSHTYAAGDWVAQGLEGGADGYLVQPTEPRVLLATIHSLLRARNAESRLRETNRRLQDVLAEREELLRREAEARKEAEQANVLKDQFLATLSHELRTPLNAIVGWTHVLRTASDDDALRERAIDVISRNSRLQARLIEEILDVSRIVSGKLALKLREVDWMAVLEAAVEAVRPAAEAKGLAVEVVIERVPMGVDGDPMRLQQVVTNLVGNAVKFSETGRIELRLGMDEGHVRLTVSDEGDGIPPEFLPHVFERFRQADSSPSRTQTGLGLGLTIVRHIVEMHGGSVRAENRGDRRGARFTVTLPLQPSRAPQAAAPARPAAARRVLAGGRVLVVDDDPDSLSLIETVLRRHEAQVALARSAAEARQALQAGPVDVVLCDIGMPGEHGLEFVQWLRAQPEHSGIRVLALTAYAGDADRERALSAGFDAYVTKPVEIDALVARVAEALGPAAPQ
jgi:signal transduction histidine kinase/ActR/RegA family two-component response regulator